MIKEIKNYSQLQKLISNNKNVDVFRFAIDPKKLDFLVGLLSKAKKKFKKKLFRINLMYLSKWFKDYTYANNLLKKINEDIDEVALVDSYGSLKPIETHIFFKNIINNNKDKKIGCHFHNNCGLALANTLSAIEAGCATADSTLKGMRELVMLKQNFYYQLKDLINSTFQVMILMNFWRNLNY